MKELSWAERSNIVANLELKNRLDKDDPLVVAHVKEMTEQKDRQITSAIEDLVIAFEESKGFNKINNPIFRALLVLGWRPSESRISSNCADTPPLNELATP